jgi:mono/diheme cytochrome c family protein
VSDEVLAGIVRAAARVPRYALALVLSFFLTSCEWFTDFKRQPSIWTWEAVKDSTTPSRGNPQNSVPTTGMAVAGYEVSYAGFPATVDSMSALANPRPASDSSLVNGRKYYQINCAVCHGDAGAGDGTVTRFGMPVISIVTDMTKARSDGYIFGMIRNGRGLMPPYNRIEEMDRWDIVNYVRGLQGAGGRTVAVGPLAAPGVTGDKMPGPSQMGPTRPAPFMSPRGVSSLGAKSAVRDTAPIPAAPVDTAATQTPAGRTPAATQTPRAGPASTTPIGAKP